MPVLVPASSGTHAPALRLEPEQAAVGRRDPDRAGAVGGRSPRRRARRRPRRRCRRSSRPACARVPRVAGHAPGLRLGEAADRELGKVVLPRITAPAARRRGRPSARRRSAGLVEGGGAERGDLARDVDVVLDRDRHAAAAAPRRPRARRVGRVGLGERRSASTTRRRSAAGRGARSARGRARPARARRPRPARISSAWRAMPANASSVAVHAAASLSRERPSERRRRAQPIRATDRRRASRPAIASRRPSFSKRITRQPSRAATAASSSSGLTDDRVADRAQHRQVGGRVRVGAGRRRGRSRARSAKLAHRLDLALAVHERPVELAGEQPVVVDLVAGADAAVHAEHAREQLDQLVAGGADDEGRRAPRPGGRAPPRASAGRSAAAPRPAPRAPSARSRARSTPASSSLTSASSFSVASSVEPRSRKRTRPRPSAPSGAG